MSQRCWLKISELLGKVLVSSLQLLLSKQLKGAGLVTTVTKKMEEKLVLAVCVWLELGGVWDRKDQSRDREAEV